MKSYIATLNDNDMRLSRFCEKVCPLMPKNLLYKSFRNKRIKVNGKKQDADYKIKTNDLIELYINDEFFTKENKEIKEYSNQLNIIYEDENILLVNKPQGLLCHSDNKNEDNLIDIIISYLNSKNQFSANTENTFTPALCNRIDQGTEGIVIAAKNYKALSDMNCIIRDNLISKKYICITNNAINGEYHAYLTRNKQTKKVTVTKSAINNESKNITTIFKTLQTKRDFNLVECTLITGRTHQIRAHLSYLKSPILADRKYGAPHKVLKSQMLCAYKLSFKSIPESNILSYLSGKTFILNNSFVKDFFDQLS